MKFPTTLILLFSTLMLQAAGFSERIQLTTDKNSYLSGEDLLVAVTTTDDQGRPVDFSKVAYIELTDSVRVQAQLMVKVESSTGQGIMSLPKNLPTGYYRLRAYTRWMRNEGPGVFTNQLIAVVNAETLHHSQTGRTVMPEGLPVSADGVVSSGSDAGKDLLQGGSRILVSDRARYGRRAKGVLRVEGLPAGTTIYQVSIAAEMGLTSAPVNQFHSSQLSKQTNSLLAEYEGHIITASVRGISPAARAVLLSVPGNSTALVAGRKTINGDYEFITRNLVGTTELAISIDTRDEEQFTLDYRSPFADTDSCRLPELRIDSASLNNILQRHIALQARQIFQPQLYTQTPTLIRSDFTPEWTYRLEEYTRFNTLEEVVLEYVTNVRFRRVNGVRTLAVNREGLEGYTLGNTLVLLDNVPVFNHDLLLHYDATLIEKIDVYRGQYVFSGQLYDGMVAFTSKTGDFRGFELDRSTLISTYKGPQAAFALTPPAAMQLPYEPDFRTTLLFETHQSSKPVQLDFVTSDFTGTYKVSLMGVTNNGTTFSESFFIEVI